jgi:hypothetical protein
MSDFNSIDYRIYVQKSKKQGGIFFFGRTIIVTLCQVKNVTLPFPFYIGY